MDRSGLQLLFEPVHIHGCMDRNIIQLECVEMKLQMEAPVRDGDIEEEGCRRRWERDYCRWVGEEEGGVEMPAVRVEVRQGRSRCGGERRRRRLLSQGSRLLASRSKQGQFCLKLFPRSSK
jgi:hypothetical protein